MWCESILDTETLTYKAVLAAYCPDFNQCIYTTGSASRSAITADLNLASFAASKCKPTLAL